MSVGEAPGKVILLGEHAVVYGHPALAAPVPQVRARAELLGLADARDGELRIEAPDIGVSAWLREIDSQSALAATLRLTQSALGLASRLPAATLRITSTIPVASGMGSGAAVTLAIVRAICAFLGTSLSFEEQSAIALEVDKIHHGTPSGIDNTVITYGRLVRFQPGEPTQFLHPARSIPLVVAHSGIASPTTIAVGCVRRHLQEAPAATVAVFETVHHLVDRGSEALKLGDLIELGHCLDENHTALQALGVSSPDLDRLVGAARTAGALGAKLSGAGMGGTIVAVVDPGYAPEVVHALQAAGASRIIETEVQA